MRDDPLLQPFQLKHLRLKNRVMITAHEPAYAEDGLPKDRYRAYHVERAKGGVALTMTAGSASVARDSPPVFNNVLAYKDEAVPWMRRLVDECHEHGAAVMIQITHLGRRTRWDKGDWLPAVSAGFAREPAHRAFPKQVEEWDIARIIRDFADAAERMKAAGLDGLEIEAYGHLVDQFFSPLTNALEAPYGGSLDNRLRFAFDMLRAIRARVGPTMILGVRFSADDTLPGGFGAEEATILAIRLQESGLVDFLNVVKGQIATDAGLTDLIPIQGMASAPHLDAAGAIRAAARLPTFHAARIGDVATARFAIASGKVDMIGLTRPHIADPHIVRKIMARREETIRPCVGANYCLDRIYQGGEALCAHNAASGRELTMPHVVPRAVTARTIVIVGAGPGGLECARVAAERGHRVVIFEAAPEAGGQIRLQARSPRKREMMGIVDWRLARCREMGVDFRFNALAGEDDILAEDPDVVIIATGGLPQKDVLVAGDDLTVSAWDILSGDAKPGANVLIFDDAGDAAGLQAADVIAAAGGKVEIMTPDRTFAPEVMAMNLTPFMRSLQKRDVTFTVTFRLMAAQRAGNQIRARIGSDYGGVEKERLVDQLVINHGTRPLDELYFALKPISSNLGAVDYDALIAGRTQALAPNPGGAFQLFRIGDAVAARNIHAAIYDALRLAKDL